MNADTRILVVDEQPLNRLLVQSLLESGGYRSDTAADGPEAIESLLRRPYALVLLDLSTDAAAIAWARQVRALGGRAATIPILAFSTDQPAETSGLNGWIAKPLDPADLLARVAVRLGPVAGGADQPDAQAIDEGQLAALRASMTAEAFDALLANYLAGARGRLARIEAIIDTGDLAALAREAHDLNSTSGSFGVIGLARLARLLEQACKSGDLATARDLATGLRAGADPVWDVLERLGA